MQKLKILLVAHNKISNYAGAGKVHYELKQEFEKAGHIVEKVDINDLFPHGQNTIQKILGSSFRDKILKYLKENAYKYDVIDANITNIIWSKEAFGFKGLLFARSHGIMPLYDKAEQTTAFQNFYAEEENNITLKKRVGRFIRGLHKKKELNLDDFHASIKHADIIHCLNQNEYDYFIDIGISAERLVLIPNGLHKNYLDNLAVSNINREKSSKTVSFIGAWHFVKGIKDWREISKLLLRVNNFKEILILGTIMSEDYVKKDFDKNTLPFLKITAHYKPAQLPALLKDVKVGIFTSYMEGFGYAVLEKLASGIPVVAYKVPGITDFLLKVDPYYLVEPGDIDELVNRVKYLLEMPEDEFKLLSIRCIDVSKEYILEKIAPLFIKTYINGLKTINQNHSC